MAVAFLKYSSSVPSKQSKTTKCDLSGNVSPLRVPRPSICSKRMRDFDRPQEDDELQVGNVHAGGEHIDGDDDARARAVAELADALQGPVHGRAAGDLLHEGIAAAEDVAADLDQLVGVRSVRQVVDGEDQRLGKAAVLLLRAPARTS